MDSLVAKWLKLKNFWGFGCHTLEAKVLTKIACGHFQLFGRKVLC